MKCDGCGRTIGPIHRVKERNHDWFVYCEDCMIEYAPTKGTLEEFLK